MSDLLSEIEEADRSSVNGGMYVGRDRRDEVEELVDAGEIVRLRNPAGVSPIYVPMSSDHYTTERLERLRDKQSEGDTERP